MDSTPGYKDRNRLLAAIGIVLLASGAALAFLGPLETYCFSLFSDGGRFHYEGFGFGSFMFAVIAGQVIGYPLIGAPLIAVAFFVVAGTKDLSPAGSVAVIVCFGLSYLVVPGILIRFYRGVNVRRTFEARDHDPRGLGDLPVPIVVLSCLYLFFIVALGMLLLFRGLFPLFGTFPAGPRGIVLIEVCMACLACLVAGTLRRLSWAWWGAVILVGLLALSTVLSLSLSSYPEILAALGIPEAETAFFGGIPAQGWHFAIFTGLPLLATWIIAVASKRWFTTVHRRAP